VIADLPTQGLDVGATEFVRNKLIEAKKNKAGVLLISEDLDEVLELSDWVAPMYEARSWASSPGGSQEGSRGWMMQASTRRRKAMRIGSHELRLEKRFSVTAGRLRRYRSWQSLLLWFCLALFSSWMD